MKRRNLPGARWGSSAFSIAAQLIGRIVRRLTYQCDFHHRPPETGPGRIQIKIMTLRSKVAAMTLAVTILIVPSAALATCWSHQPSIGKGSSECQMTRHIAAESIQQATAPTLCCELSSGTPVPASVAQAPSGIVDGITPTLVIPSVDVPSVMAEALPMEPIVRASGSALQAILCTFLI